MAFNLTYESRARLRGVKPRTASADDALSAWELYVRLGAGDEKVTSIRDPSGQRITAEQLCQLANKQAN
jgi:hypothetical protein